MRVRELSIVLALAVAADVARPDNCEAAFPPPADFAVSIKPGIGAGADYVHITWTPDQALHSGVNFSNYVVQRRDDTAGGGFVPIYTTTFRYSGFTTQLIADPDHSPSCLSANGCVEPGHTYTYRVIVQFTYAVGCPLHDGQPHDSTPSTEAQLVVPGGEPDTAPKNFVACAETKTNRVHLYWDRAPNAAKTKTKTKKKWIVERRKVLSAKSSSEKAETEWERIATVADKVLQFTDKSATDDELLEYRIGAVLTPDVVPQYSKPDAAHPRGTVCRGATPGIWPGRWTAAGLGDNVYEFDFSLRDRPRLLEFEAVEFDPDVQTFMCTGKAPGVAGSRLSWSATAVVDAKPLFGSEWPATFTETTTGRFTVTLVETESPFSVDAFVKAKAVLSFTTKTGVPKDTYDLVRTFPVGEDAGKPIDVRLCATVAAGTNKFSNLKPGKFAPVKPGDPVVFLYQVVVLGPSPLYPRHAAVDVVLENGTIKNILPMYATEVQGNPDGTKHASIDIGALGPDERGRPEVATFALTATVQDGDPGRQLRATFTLKSGSGHVEAVETLRLDTPVRVVELPIR